MLNGLSCDYFIINHEMYISNILLCLFREKSTKTFYENKFHTYMDFHRHTKTKRLEK